jgi:hypothetical protein
MDVFAELKEQIRRSTGVTLGQLVSFYRRAGEALRVLRSELGIGFSDWDMSLVFPLGHDDSDDESDTEDEDDSDDEVDAGSSESEDESDEHEGDSEEEGDDVD